MWAIDFRGCGRVLKHPPLASSETSQSTCGIDCFPFLGTNQADDDKSVYAD